MKRLTRSVETKWRRKPRGTSTPRSKRSLVRMERTSSQTSAPSATKTSQHLQTLSDSSPVSLEQLLKLPIEQELERRLQSKQLREVRKDADSVRARCKTLVGFIREAWTLVEPDPANKYVHGWHIDAICQHLEAITSGKLRQLGLENRLLINVPPGSMKSLIVNVFWPAWEWGPVGKPNLKYVCSSYKEALTDRDSRRMRRLITSEWYQALWPMALIKETERLFENNFGGWRACSAFKSIIGMRGDRVLIDDPHSLDTAESDIEREKAARDFCEVVPLRVISPENSAIIVIMQRLHEGDVSGTILSRRFPYIHLMLPMEFEEDRRCETPLGFKDPRTYDGELLFPGRFPRSVVDRDKASLLEYGTACQFQQSPVPRGGGQFKKEWFKVVPAIPAGPIDWVRGWDLAATERAKNNRAAYTAGVKLGRYADTGMYIIADVARGQLDASDVEKLIVNTASQDGPECEVDLPLDPGQASKIQIRYLVTALAGYITRWSPETGAKEVRSEPVAAQAAVGNILLLRGPWNQAFLDEIGLYPSGIHKDQVDALSRAFGRHVQNNRAFGGIPVGPQILNLREMEKEGSNGSIA